MRIVLPSLHGVMDDKNRMNNSMSQSKRYVQLLAMAQTGKKLESWATGEDKKIYQEMIEADKTMRRTAKELGIKNPIMEIPLEVEF